MPGFNAVLLGDVGGQRDLQGLAQLAAAQRVAVLDLRRKGQPPGDDLELVQRAVERGEEGGGRILDAGAGRLIGADRDGGNEAAAAGFELPEAGGDALLDVLAGGDIGPAAERLAVERSEGLAAVFNLVAQGDREGEVRDGAGVDRGGGHEDGRDENAGGDDELEAPTVAHAAEDEGEHDRGGFHVASLRRLPRMPKSDTGRACSLRTARLTVIAAVHTRALRLRETLR